MPRQFNIPQQIVAKVRDKNDPTGPVAYSQFMTRIHNEHVIVVNNGYQLGSWPDICFFGDHGWYMVHRMALAKWPGLKVNCCRRDLDGGDGVKYVRRDPDKNLGLSPHPRRVAWGFNSGSAAIDFGIHLGVKQVILLGFDMNHGPAGESHWHRGHGNEHRPRPNYDRFMKGFLVMANDAKKIGVEIINCSLGSGIKDFPIMSLDKALRISP